MNNCALNSELKGWASFWAYYCNCHMLVLHGSLRERHRESCGRFYFSYKSGRVLRKLAHRSTPWHPWGMPTLRYEGPMACGWTSISTYKSGEGSVESESFVIQSVIHVFASKRCNQHLIARLWSPLAGGWQGHLLSAGDFQQTLCTLYSRQTLQCMFCEP